MIYNDLPEAEYRALRAYGSTDLKNALRSHQHMIAARQSFHETPALRFGRAFHCAVLEPKKFETDYKVMPEFSGRGSRDAKEKWCIHNSEKVPLSAEDFETIEKMERALRKHDAAFNLLLDCDRKELSLTWEESHHGQSLAMKARLDGLAGAWAIMDLKTTTDASPEAFGRQAAQLNYLLQAAHYVEGAMENRLRGIATDFVFIAVEKEAPYGVGVYTVGPDELEIGRRLRQKAIDQLIASSQKTTPYSSTALPLHLPAWAYRGIE